MKFCFGDIVVVEQSLIGVVVKSYKDNTHDVYVRMLDNILTYTEMEIERYMVRHEYLSEEELQYQDNAMNRK